ncbi:hypothetical protein SSAG_00607 [Streptomyces sp. Mg1]|nr:hypothetical protein SSAG_00607 [Streptomyces sp. Mg1]
MRPIVGRVLLGSLCLVLSGFATADGRTRAAQSAAPCSRQPSNTRVSRSPAKPS